MTRYEFEQMLDEETVTIVGHTYPAGWALRTIDPVAFDELLWNYRHAMKIDEDLTVE